MVAHSHSCVSNHCSASESLFTPLGTRRSETQWHCAWERAKKHLFDEKSFSLYSWNQAGLSRHFICAHFLNGCRMVAIIKGLHILHISPFILSLARQLCSWKQPKVQRQLNTSRGSGCLLQNLSRCRINSYADYSTVITICQTTRAQPSWRVCRCLPFMCCSIWPHLHCLRLLCLSGHAQSPLQQQLPNRLLLHYGLVCAAQCSLFYPCVWFENHEDQYLLCFQSNFLFFHFGFPYNFVLERVTKIILWVWAWKLDPGAHLRPRAQTHRMLVLQTFT